MAEEECKRLSAVQPDVKLDMYDFMFGHLEGRVKAAKEASCQWSRWATPEEQKDLQCRMRELEICMPRLISGKAALMQAKIEQEGQPVTTHCPQVASIKLRPTALPKFDGNKRNFHHWRKDWEAVQKQGEPTGSKEDRKFQLLDSFEKKVAADLRLLNYGTAEDICQILENRFGNKTRIEK